MLFKYLQCGVIMIISDVNMRTLLFKGKMNAIVLVTMNDTIIVDDVKTYEGKSGLFFAMPSSQEVFCDNYDIAYPIAGDMIQNSIFTAYRCILATMKQQVIFLTNLLVVICSGFIIN